VTPAQAKHLLSPLTLARAGYRQLWQCRDDFLRLAIVPATLQMLGTLYGKNAIDAISQAMLEGNASSALGQNVGDLFVMGLTGFTAVMVFSVNWLQLLLAGPEAVPGLGLRLGKAHLQCAFLAMAFFVIFIAAIALSGNIRLLLTPPLRPYLDIVIPLICMIGGARLTLVFAGLAIGRPLDLANAWRNSRGNGIRLFIALVFAQLPLLLGLMLLDSVALALGLAEQAPLSLLFLGTLGQLLACAAQMGAVAVAFRQLMGVVRA